MSIFHIHQPRSPSRTFDSQEILQSNEIPFTNSFFLNRRVAHFPFESRSKSFRSANEQRFQSKLATGCSN